jgi:hypothetical protein
MILEELDRCRVEALIGATEGDEVGGAETKKDSIVLGDKIYSDDDMAAAIVCKIVFSLINLFFIYCE